MALELRQNIKGALLSGFLSAVLSVFLFVSLWLIYYFYSLRIDALEIKTVSSAAAIPETASTTASDNATALPPLSFGVFFDTFSSSAAVNLNESDLYLDKNATAVLYPPDYDWRPASGNIASNGKESDWLVPNDFEGPYNDRRCLGENCLKQEGNSLSYNGKALVLPVDLKKSDIVAISLGSLDKLWLVGFTLKDGKKYRGEVYYFDGRTFSPLATPAPIISSYFGLFGFGGEEDDFLIIYGAYEGIAYHIQKDKLTDVSRFFDIRVMNNGFKPEIIRAVYQDNINWYVFSFTRYRPRLIKLWQNRTPEIAGETVFEDLFTPADESAEFKLLETGADKIVILSKIKSAAADSWRVFSDYGFKNDKAGSLVFNPVIYDGEASPIAIKKIVASRLDLDAASLAAVKFLFADEGDRWREIPLGRDFDFVVPTLKNFFLKVAFPPFQDKFYSPFLTAVLFDYYCEK